LPVFASSESGVATTAVTRMQRAKSRVTHRRLDIGGFRCRAALHVSARAMLVDYPAEVNRLAPARHDALTHQLHDTDPSPDRADLA
jgi:hypothetical protein